MTFYLNPAENKPQFVQGGKKTLKVLFNVCIYYTNLTLSITLCGGEKSLACYWSE